MGYSPRGHKVIIFLLYIIILYFILEYSNILMIFWSGFYVDSLLQDSSETRNHVAGSSSAQEALH